LTIKLSLRPHPALAANPVFGGRGMVGTGPAPFEVALAFTPWIGPCDGPKRKSIAAQLVRQSQM